MTQLALPMPPQPRNRSRESRRLYGYVLALRKARHKVRKEGRWHVVDGARLTAWALAKKAQGVGV